VRTRYAGVRWAGLAAVGCLVLSGCWYGEQGPRGGAVASRPPRLGETRTFALPNGGRMDLVWIEPGTFAMGSPASEAGRSDEDGPQHQVTITRGFWMGRYEVTQSQWQAVMGNNPSQLEGANRPVVYVSWDDVHEFIARLNQAAGQPVYRLPSEAEWEYACRAGTTTRWSFGEAEARLGEYAWWYKNSRGRAHDVGGRKPNPWGLYDMHGNVEEWVEDRFGPYSPEAQIDPQGPASSDLIRVLRGGTFGNMARNTRSARHPGGASAFRGCGLGFRLLRTD
jgi:formylglycine-generating enzyme required for sulfatase activity